MIYNYKKYKNIDDFVNNIPKSIRNEQYTILHKCSGLDIKTRTFNSNCFACLFCVVNDKELQDLLVNNRGLDFIASISRKAFDEEIIDSPKTLSGLKHPYNSFERFTSVDETTNIQPWVAGIISNTCSCSNRVSMEIPIFNLDYDRNGRLDVGIMCNNYLIAIETKTTLDDALADERFIEQYHKYTIEIEKSIKQYTYLTLIGGRESDLLPIQDSHCTGIIGDKTSRFYSKIDKNRIKFISANALLCICAKFLAGNEDFACDKILSKVFKDENCIGLLSCGKIIKDDDKYLIQRL